MNRPHRRISYTLVVIAIATQHQATQPLLTQYSARQQLAAAEVTAGEATEVSGGLTSDVPAATKIALEAIESLESNSYPVRVRATDTLLGLGRAGIAPILNAIEKGNGGPETASRTVYVLRQLALTEPDEDGTATVAYEAIVSLSKRRFNLAARRAKSALHTIHEVRQKKARVKLIKQGAVLADYPVVVPMQNTALFRSVQIGTSWRGKLAQLEQLRWLTQPLDAETEPPWMIVLQGQQVSNEWIDVVAKLENVAVIKVKGANINDDAIKLLKQSKSLQIIELLYNPITDKGFEHLANLQAVDRFRLIGNKMTPAANSKFQQQVAPVEVDFRLGGFLGVGCEEAPCRINRVQVDTAADKAGFQVGDVIVQYNGTEVDSMTELTAEIAKHKSTEKVTVVIRRGGETITREVVLGEWD